MNSLGLVIILSLVKEASLTGILELKMKTFNNPSHRIPRGRCCDTILPPCNKNRCDNYFKKICLTAPNGMNCGIGNTATGVIRENTDNINFGRKINNVSNPIVYTFAKWEEFFKLEIEIWDKDRVAWKRYDDLILMGEKTIIIPASREKSVSISKEVKIENRYSKLVLEVRVYCDEGYFIPSCEEYCTFTNNSSGHYSCDFVTGEKLCLDGWHGSHCNKYCIPQDDEMGHYRCDNTTGEIICLPGWRNEIANCTDEIDECNSSPCKNNGTCNNLIGSYNCTCQDGFTGKHCESYNKDGGSTKTMIHRSTTKSVNPSYSLNTDALIALSTVSLYKPVQRTADSSQMYSLFKLRSSSTPESSEITSFINSKIQTAFHDYKTKTANIDVKMTATMTTSIGKDIEFISTNYKSTFYSNLMHATSLDYKMRTDATTLEMMTSSHNEKTMHGFDATVSSNSSMNTTIYNDNQLVVTSHIKMSRISKSLSSTKQTKWPLVQPSEASHTVKLKGSATLGQALSKAASSSIDLNLGTNVLLATSTLYWDQKIYGSTIDPKYIGVTASYRASEYLPQSSFREPRYKLEEFRVRMQIKVTGNKWDRKVKEMFEKELCLSITSICKYDFGCDMTNSSVHPEFTFERKKGADNLVIASLKFTEVLKTEDRKDADKCFQKAILDASKKIEGSMPLKIISVTFVKEEDEKAKKDRESSADEPEESDISKFLASVIVGNVLLITVILIGIGWNCRRRSAQRVQPSPKLMKNDTATNRRFYGAKEYETNVQSNNNNQGVIGAYKGIKMKMPTMSGNYSKQILLETNEKYLETFFL